MSEKKTILFNDSFMTSMGGNKTKKNKKPKKRRKPKQATLKPNKLKKDLYLKKLKNINRTKKLNTQRMKLQLKILLVFIMILWTH